MIVTKIISMKTGMMLIMTTAIRMRMIMLPMMKTTYSTIKIIITLAIYYVWLYSERKNKCIYQNCVCY